MSLEATTSLRQEVATLTLRGEADCDSATRISELIDALTGVPLKRLVFDLSGLTYLSSVGLRRLLFAHQKLGRDVEIVIGNASEDVQRTFLLTGFHQSVTWESR